MTPMSAPPVFALLVGRLELDRGMMIPDGGPAARWTVPVLSILVVHPRGRLVFDTGVHCQTITDALGRLGEERMKRFGVRSERGDDVVSQLAKLGVAPRHVRYVVNSHFHFDHCGGNEFFPHATFLVQRAEMEGARSADVIATGRYRPSAQDFDLPLDYELVDGERDVFGDGTVLLVPTHGHTPGHQSLVVRRGKSAPLVFAADACYTRENMDRDLLPGVVWDPDEMSRSLAVLRAMRDQAGATMFYGHDPAQWPDASRLPVALG
jgi:N-acyl homoserine lactone hydrolase